MIFNLRLISFYVVFGMTEVMGVFLTPRNESSLDNVGKAIPGTQVKFVDLETGKPNPPGKPGEVLIKNSHVSVLIHIYIFIFSIFFAQNL